MARCRRFLVCRYPLWALALLTASGLGGQPLVAQDLKPTVNSATASGATARLGDLAKLPQPAQYGFHEANPYRRIAKRDFGKSVDPVEQSSAAPSTNYSIIANFLGVGNGFQNYQVPDAPPDSNMAVGNTQILQWVNVSYTICSKTPPNTCGPAIRGNTLWAAGIPGTLCANNNDGDILAQFDRQADRWFLSQNVFVSPYATCIAISDTSDATGTWHVWQFSVPGAGFPDYPKIGIWPTSGVNNGYYQAQNNFGPGGSGFMGPQICAYDRAAILAHAASPTQICFQLSSSEDNLLPGDLDSPVGPPNKPDGTPQDEFFIGSVAAVDNSHLSLYQFHADFTTPANSFVLGSPNTILIPVPTYSGSCAGAFGGNCVPQLGTSDRLDSLGDRLMYRFAYWNGNAQQAIEASDLMVFQTGTYAPDSNYRWMGSVAADRSNDILVGYSESSSTIHPAIYLAGRVADTNIDPLNTLESELLVVAGNGSQPDTSNRWGDYSSMRIDPIDNCTFWYTTEYYSVTQTFDWSTQINSAKFSNCGSCPAPRQHWYVNFDVEASGGQIGVRWMELTSSAVQVASQTMLMSSSPNNTSNVNDPVTFTATVSGRSCPPTGTVTFTNDGNPIPECPNPVNLNSDEVAQCVTHSLPAGYDLIKASYSGDSTYAPSSDQLTQTVQDFSLLSISPGAVTVIQSFNNTNEPFFAQTINLTVQPLYGYGGTVTLSCSVNPVLINGTCMVNPPSSGSLAGGNLNTTLAISAGSSTPIGSYTVTVTAQDRIGLMRFATLALTVICYTDPIQMPPGGAGRTPVCFAGPPGTIVNNFSCPLVSGTGITGSEDLSKIGGVCTFSPGSVTLPGSVIVTISGCTVAGLRTRTTILAAFWLGMPAMVLLGSVRNKRLSRKRMLQIVAMLLLILALLMGVGCGGGYGQLTLTGLYSVLVQGTSTDGTVYSAVVPVQVVPLSK